MIAVERPDATVPDLQVLAPAPVQVPAPALSRARRPGGFLSRATAALLGVSLLGTLGGSWYLFDPSSAFGMQSRATALHARWLQMEGDGVPDTDLSQLQQEWAYSQRTSYLGVGSVFWWPGAGAVLDRWQAQTDAAWAHELNLTRAGALAAEQTLHRALGAEPKVQLKARLDALAGATTPADYATLRSDWGLEARLIPIDRRIGGFVGRLSDQARQATALGILSTPAADFLARANDYGNSAPLERMAVAELLTRGLISTQNDLQGRLDAATITQAAFNHATDEINLASVYGLDLSSYQPRIATNRGAFGAATTVAVFNSITADLSQIVAAADQAINATMSVTHLISGVAFYYQNYPLSCEEAATQMALTHQGINLSQDQILAEMGADRRRMYVDGDGVVRWGNPYETFVGSVNGSEYNYTGFGANYPPLVRVARAHGAKIIAYGSMSAATIYARVIAGHPVVAYATWDWAWHPRHDYLSFDGQWIPWIGPVQASHVYTVVGVSPSSVLVNDPIRGQYWVSKAAFEAAYSDFEEAIVFA